MSAFVTATSALLLLTGAAAQAPAVTAVVGRDPPRDRIELERFRAEVERQRLLQQRDRRPRGQDSADIVEEDGTLTGEAPTEVDPVVANDDGAVVEEAPADDEEVPDEGPSAPVSPTDEAEEVLADEETGPEDDEAADDDVDEEVDEDTEDDGLDDEETAEAAGSGSPAAPGTPAVAVAPGTYSAFVGRDYIPKKDGSNMVPVEDITPGSMLVSTQEECQTFCDSTDGCNAASYYLDGSIYGNKNCWLKQIANPCTVPADAAVDENAVLLLKSDDTCVEAVAPGQEVEDAPLGPEDDLSGAPESAMMEGEGDDTTDAPPSTERTFLPDVEESPSAAVSVRGVAIALAVAGAAACL